MPLSRVKPAVVIAFLCLGIIVVILLFTFCSFDVNPDDVITGYNNTRKYAADVKKLQFAVDNFKEVVVERQEDEDARQNVVGTEVTGLGKWNAMLTKEEYEEYTNTFVLSADPNVYPSEISAGNGRRLPSTSKVLSAKYNGDVINYLTTDNKVCSPSTELDMYGAIQCAAFADAYVNQMSYKEYALDKGTWLITGGAALADEKVFASMGTAWRSNGVGALSFENDAEGMHKFFCGVTPGTFVRTQSQNVHSYIILGGDDNGLLIYDANSDMKCGIKLRYLTWSELVIPRYKDDSCYATDICLVIAPPNTTLPLGVDSNEYGGRGYILGKEGGS